MANKSRLTPKMTDSEKIITMASGKPATLDLLQRLVDDNHYMTIHSLEFFDTLGIYGSNIFRLYTDYCNESSFEFSGLVADMVKMSDEAEGVISEVRKFLGLEEI